jgi:hypothetical protein
MSYVSRQYYITLCYLYTPEHTIYNSSNMDVQIFCHIIFVFLIKHITYSMLKKEDSVNTL